MTLHETPSCATEFLHRGESPLAPGQDGLFQLCYPGDAAGDQFAQRVDHGRRRRVDPVFLRDPEADQGAGSSDGA